MKYDVTSALQLSRKWLMMYEMKGWENRWKTCEEGGGGSVWEERGRWRVNNVAEYI